jgi:DNA-binding Xre family transcriptional regulator
MQNYDTGKSLRVLQAKSGITSGDLAQMLNVSPQVITRYRSQKDMKLSKIVTICNALKVNVQEFLDFGV